MTLPGLKIVTKKNGRRFVYFRAPGGALTALPDLEFDDPRFLSAYAAAKGEVASLGPPPGGRSLDALARLYFASPPYRELAPSSQEVRRRVIGHILNKGGAVQVRAIERIHIQRDLDSLSRGATHSRLAAWRALMRLALQQEWRDSDPTVSVTKPAYRKKSHARWTPEDCAAFVARWPVGTQQRTAFELLFWLGCRRSDLVALGWQNVRDGWMVWRQRKTKGLVEIPISLALAEALSHCPRDRMTFLETLRGVSRSDKAFGEWFRKACHAAGVFKSAHGLRHEFGSAIAEAGLGDGHVSAGLGHASTAEAATYTKEARRRRMAAEAMQRLERERSLETTPKKVGNQHEFPV
ncbi:MAG: tyrosine-type recombinase/integrase [Acuticoccus sp.]